MPKNKDKIKVVENEWKDDLPFPQLLDYRNLLYTPQKLEDINKPEGDKLLAINDAGNFINDIINPRIDTATKTILSDFSFGVSGALQIGTFVSGVSGDIRISPAGIVGRNSAGVNTFTIDGATGSATFRGDITGSTITGGTITGSAIRTAGTGKRINMEVFGPFAHHLEFFNFLSERRAIIRIGLDDRFDIRADVTANTDMHIIANRNMQVWASGELALGADVSMNRLYPSLNDWGNVGRSDRKYRWAYVVNYLGCDLPTIENACDIFKRIKKPTRNIPGERKHFGNRYYFKIEDFPEEMKVENDKDELDIEMTRTLGVTVQAVKELVDRVEFLENKIKI